MSKRILIVEDDQNMQNIYKTYFSDMKGEYALEIVGTGMEAFKRLQEKKYDLILLDMIMEPMGGDALFTILREDSINKETPVLIVSVLGPQAAAVKFILKNKHTYYVQKPISKDDLLELVAERLSS